MKRKSLDIVKHVYGEEAGESLDELIELDDALHDEYVALREAKALMDARPRRRPSAATVDAILQAARSKKGTSRDRKAVPPVTRLHPALRLARLTRPLGYAVAACLLVVSGYWIGLQNQSGQPDTLLALEEPLMEQNEEMPAGLSASRLSVASEGEDLAIADDLDVIRAKSLKPVLAWEDSDDLYLIQWRVGSLEENLVGASWDEAVPLTGMMSSADMPAQSDVVSDSALRRIDR